MEISTGIQIKKIALFIEKEKLLVLGDLHLGYEESLNKQGVMIPRFQLKDIMGMLKEIIEETHPEIIVLNGDIKHEFGQISEQEWRDALKVLDYLKENCNKLVLIKGNHDKITSVIADKRDMKCVKHYNFGDVYITHGDFIPSDLGFIGAKTIIIGHEHPAVSLKEGNRVEKYKCFLKGRYDKKELIVMPSSNPITEGTDILQEELLSPFLKKGIENFDVFVLGDETLPFGKVKDINKES